MNLGPKLGLLALVLASACGGCSNDDGPDASIMVDMSHPDVDVGPDAEGDVGDLVEGCPAIPLPQVAGTPETDALAAAAERCGEAPFAWRTDDTLGDVLEWGQVGGVDATFLSRLGALGYVLPGPPELDVDVTPFRYVTQDRGELVEATAVLAVPRGIEPGSEKGVVLYLHGALGVTDVCAPSGNALQRAVPALFASYGFVVVAPDYIGLKSMGEASTELHPFLVPQPTVTSALDAVRAVLKAGPERVGGACLQNRVALWGLSQGAHAAVWVQRLAPYYARELEVVGGAAAAAPIDLVRLAEAVTTKITDPGTYYIAEALMTAAPRHGANLGDLLIPPYDTTGPAGLTSGCLTREFEPLRDAAQPGDLFTSDYLAAAEAGELAGLAPWGCILAESSVNRASIPIVDDSPGPILVAFGEADEIVETESQRDAFDELCAQGASLQYMECAGDDHTEVSLKTFATVVAFIEARLAGDDPGSLCQRSAPRACGE